MHADGRPGPDFIYTKNSKSQNQHGRNLQGQSAMSSYCFGPRVALCFRMSAVGAKAIDAFFNFERFEILHLPDLLVSLAPPSPSVKKFDLRDGSRTDPSEDKRSPCPPL